MPSSLVDGRMPSSTQASDERIVKRKKSGLLFSPPPLRIVLYT